MKFEKQIKLTPRGNYILTTFYLHGTLGIIQFAYEAGKELGIRGWDVGYHSPKPIYADQSKISDCPLLEGECYSDGSSLMGEEFLELLLKEGEDRIWQELEKLYHEWLEKPIMDQSPDKAPLGTLINAILVGIKPCASSE